MDTRMEAMLQGGPFKKLLEEQIAELRQKYDMKKAELEICISCPNVAAIIRQKIFIIS